MDRAAVFIDGFNLYHGMQSAGLRPWLWVDLCRLSYAVTPKTLKIVQVNYYTATVRGQSDSRDHQDRFLAAQTICNPSGFNLVHGFMQSEQRRCKANCKEEFSHWAEKRTDVNLALDLAFGATRQDFEVAVLISGDADQVRAVEISQAANVPVVAAFPPDRHSNHLEKVADTAFVIGEGQIEASQMKDVLMGADGRKIERPVEWGPRPGFDGPAGPPPVPHFPD